MANQYVRDHEEDYIAQRSVMWAERGYKSLFIYGKDQYDFMRVAKLISDFLEG